MRAMEPVLALTLGDVCGIGPEIVARAFASGDAHGCVVVGDVAAMRRGVAVAGTGSAIATIEHPADLADVPPRGLPLLPVPGIDLDLARLPHGSVDARAGAAAAAFIRSAVALARSGAVAGIVTAPIHKE